MYCMILWYKSLIWDRFQPNHNLHCGSCPTPDAAALNCKFGCPGVRVESGKGGLLKVCLCLNGRPVSLTLNTNSKILKSQRRNVLLLGQVTGGDTMRRSIIADVIDISILSYTEFQLLKKWNTSWERPRQSHSMLLLAWRWWLSRDYVVLRKSTCMEPWSLRGSLQVQLRTFCLSGQTMISLDTPSP